MNREFVLGGEAKPPIQVSCPSCFGDGLVDRALSIEYGLIVRPERPPFGVYRAHTLHAVLQDDAVPLGVFGSTQYFDEDDERSIAWKRNDGAPYTFSYHAEVELEGRGFRCTLLLNRRHLVENFSTSWSGGEARPFIKIMWSLSTKKLGRLSNSPAQFRTKKRIDRQTGLVDYDHPLVVWIVALDLPETHEAIELLVHEEMP